MEVDCGKFSGKVWRRGVYQAAKHLFGSVAPTAEFPQLTYLPVPTLGTGIWPKCPPEGACSSTWVVSTVGQELQRTTLGAAAVGPLNESLFEEPNALPAGVSRSRKTQIKVVITANIGSGERRFFLDVGQTIEVQADSVSVDWMAPGNATNQFVEVAPSNIAGSLPVPTRAGFVIDAKVGAEVAIIEQPIGIFEGYFTNHLVVLANTRGTIAVPPFATEVTIYQAATLGNASTQWEMHYGDPALLAATVEHGTIPFIPGARKTEPGIVIGDTEFLRTDTDANNNRFFTLRWTIRP